MSRYNHFAKTKYSTVSFGCIKIGEKFRLDKFKHGKRRPDVIMVKTSVLSYKEVKSRKEYSVVHAEFEVSVY
jgi:hypothetical protein